MAKQEHSLLKSQPASGHFTIPKSLKRWHPESVESEGSYLKRKYKKIDSKINPHFAHLYENLHLFPKCYKHCQDRNLVKLWLQTKLRQRLERPITLTNYLSPLFPFKIYLKPFPTSYTWLLNAIKRIHVLINRGKCHLIDKPEIQCENIIDTDVFALQYKSDFFEVNLYEHDSNRKFFTDPYFCVRNSSFISSIDYVMHLYHGIQGNVKKYDADIDGIKDVCEEKAFTGSNSDEARQKDDMFQNTTENCASSKYDGSFYKDIKNHEKTLASRFKKCSQEKFANASDNLLVLLNYDFSNVTNNISSNGNRNSKDSVPNKNIVKLTRNQLEPKSVTSPIVKFNLDYDKISGTSEMLLSNMFSCHELNKCKETFSDHNLEAMINDSCEKHSAVADTDQSSMVSSTNLTTCPKEETYTDFTDASESYKEYGLNNLYQTSLLNNDKKTKVMPQVFTIEAVSENKETILDSSVNHDSSCESEHVVPDISISEMVETSRSMYEEGISMKGFEENSKTVFQWIPKSLELTDLSSGDQFSYPAGQMCSRPLRLGLSKKQKVKHLHKK